MRLTILAWDSDAADQFGELRAMLAHDGQPIGHLDMMIAAQALA
jgi:predicted nucleic acid-binding protein